MSAEWGLCGAAVAVALLGCAAGPDTQAFAADEFLLSLEQRWLDEEPVHLEFDVLSEGAFEADLEGRLRWGEGDAVELSAKGTFGPDPVTLSLSVEDDRLVGGNAARRFDEPLPAELREALVIGLTRMGILHNLARLVSGAPPDRADGGARTWVEAREVRWVSENVVAGERGIAFEVWVADQRAGAATLWLDASGQLVGRDQVVQFPGGEMLVRERYRLR